MHSVFGEIMSNRGVLSDKEIDRYNLIEVESREMYMDSLQVCSYDLRLGNKHYLFDDNGVHKPVFLGKDGAELNKYTSNILNDTFTLKFPAGRTDVLVIPAFGSAIIELLENVDTRSVVEKYNQLVVGRFDLKLQVIYKGLISQQATQVEPCYYGKLYCFVHNLTSKDVELMLHERVATIEFLYSGDRLSDYERDEVLSKANKRTEKKFDGEFSYVGRGIKDIRWLGARGSLPCECGLAPINRKVNHSIEHEIKLYMEKDATVDWYSERVGKRINERQGVIKMVLSLILGVVSLFGVGFVTDVSAQLRYFEEQLAFYGDTLAGQFDEKALEEISKHTETFNSFKKELFVFLFVIILFILVILLLYYLFFSETFWIRKKGRIVGRFDYRAEKRRQRNERNKRWREKWRKWKSKWLEKWKKRKNKRNISN